MEARQWANLLGREPHRMLAATEAGPVRFQDPGKVREAIPGLQERIAEAAARTGDWRLGAREVLCDVFGVGEPHAKIFHASPGPSGGAGLFDRLTNRLAAEIDHDRQRERIGECVRERVAVAAAAIATSAPGQMALVVQARKRLNEIDGAAGEADALRSSARRREAAAAERQRIDQQMRLESEWAGAEGLLGRRDRHSLRRPSADSRGQVVCRSARRSARQAQTHASAQAGSRIRTMEKQIREG